MFHQFIFLVAHLEKKPESRQCTLGCSLHYVASFSRFFIAGRVFWRSIGAIQSKKHLSVAACRRFDQMERVGANATAFPALCDCAQILFFSSLINLPQVTYVLGSLKLLKHSLQICLMKSHIVMTESMLPANK